MVTDLEVAMQLAKEFTRALPDVGLHYAIKANNDPRIIKALSALVSGYDVASLGELDQLLALGIKPGRVLFSNPVKVPAHIKDAYKKGVRYFAFDSEAEITKLAQRAPGANVYLRLSVSSDGSKFSLSSKFGVDPGKAIRGCTAAKSAGLNVSGLTFHVGSQSENVKAWETAIKLAGQTINKLAGVGIQIEFLNLGGGFPADYGLSAPSLEDVAETILRSQAEYLPKEVKLLAEPGRYMVATTSCIVTTVIGRANRDGAEWLHLDIGAFQGLIEPLQLPGMLYPISTDKQTEAQQKSFVLTGPTCDPYDTIGAGYMLPADMAVGDRICIGATGAYSLVYASNFNGFDPPKVYYFRA
jgi:ornithine decarboxylase